MYEDKQKINCSVSSCQYNDTDGEECVLQAIKVEPVPGMETEGTDESTCGSYEYDDTLDTEDGEEETAEEETNLDAE